MSSGRDTSARGAPTSDARPARPLDQRREEVASGPIVADQLFRVPLDPDDEPSAVAELHALDDRVRRPRHVREFAPEPIDRLVMEAVYVDLQRAEDAGEPRAFPYLDLVCRNVPSLALEHRLAVIERRARLARNVLMQAAAEGDVEYLEAAADREEGNVVLYRPARQLDFESVAGRGDLGGGRVRWLAKACGLHGTGPCQQHPAEPRQ